MDLSNLAVKDALQFASNFSCDACSLFFACLAHFVRAFSLTYPVYRLFCSEAHSLLLLLCCTACLTTVGRAVHRGFCLVLVQLSSIESWDSSPFSLFASLRTSAGFFGIYSPLLKNTHGFASYLPQWCDRGCPSLAFVCQM